MLCKFFIAQFLKISRYLNLGQTTCFFIYAFYAINPFLLVLGIKEKSINRLEKQNSTNAAFCMYFLLPVAAKFLQMGITLFIGFFNLVDVNSSYIFLATTHNQLKLTVALNALVN